MAANELLLLGATGFIGRALLPVLAMAHRVTAVRFSSPAADREVPWIRIGNDPREIADLVRRERPKIVVNAAALASPAACMADPALARRLNTDLPAAVAETDARIIHLSTDQVFDGKKGNYAEGDEPAPISHYGETKLAGEHAIRDGSSNSVVLRVNLVCGRSPGPRMSSVDAMLAAAKRGEEIRLFKDEFRSPVAITDVVLAVAQLVGSNYTGLLHLGGPRLSRWELAVPILEKHGMKDRARATTIDDYQGAPRAPDTSFDCTIAKQVLGFRPCGLAGILKDC